MKLLFVLDFVTFKGKILETAINAIPYCDMMWLRIKGADTGTFIKTLETIRTRIKNAVLILSENADLAAKLGFNGVHLNKNSEDVESVRKRHPSLTIGYSAHSLGECKINADYKTLSPIFHSKNTDLNVLGAIAVKEKNVYALGGVGKKNVRFLLGKGFEGVAGISLYKNIKEIYNIIA